MRTNELTKLTAQPSDLLIIGGGITGAGIALDAQSRGMKTILLEMQDFAAGTSSRSTKLIHGGLRYLKQLEFKIVAEVGKERAILYNNAPHIINPEWMLLPIFAGGTFGKLTTSFGIRLYDYLAGVKKSERRKMLSKTETLAKEPLLKKAGLKGSGYYVEYRTDDARLTIEVLKKAIEYGASAFNYMKAVDFLYKNSKLIGVVAEDLLSQKTYKLYAQHIVNAAGPWVDELREKDGSKQEKYLHWTKGIHLVIDQSRFPLHQAVYFDTLDGRMIFAIPRDGKTYVGTTDTDYHENLMHPRFTKNDQKYLLNATNQMFPSLSLTETDVESSWAGIRPLIHEKGKAPSEISRHDEIFHSKSGLITIAGGKLTGYRKMAERVVDFVAKEIAKGGGKPLPSSKTKHIILSGGEVGRPSNLEIFITTKEQEGISLGLAPIESTRLAKRYGCNVSQVFQIIKTGKQEAKDYGLSLEVFGSLVYGINQEMVVTPVDFFVRRTGSLCFHIDWVQQWKEPVIHFMRNYFGWTKEQYDQFRTQLEQEIEYATIPLEEN